MKKVALSLIALLAAGSFAFGDATADVVKSPVTASFEVDASASWGVDLDTKVHGFSNGSTGKVTLWFLNGTSEKTGEGDVHGYISVADVQFGFDGAEDGNAPTLAIGDITAKIVAGDLYVKLFTNSDASVGYSLDGDDDSAYVVGTPSKYTDNYGGTSTEWTLGDTTSVGLFEGTGIEVGYSIPKLVSITAVIDSNRDWTSAKQDSYEGSIALGLLAVENLTLNGKFLTGQYADEQKSAFGAEFEYNATVAVPFAHFNYDVSGESWDSDFGARLPLVDGLTAVAAVQYNSDSVADFTLTANVAEAKLAGPLSAIVGVRVFDLTNANDTAEMAKEIFLSAGFKATDTVKIYGSFDMYNANTTTDSSLFLKAGIDYTGISLTTLSVNWDSSDLGAAESTGDSKNGKLVVTAKVAY